MKTYNITVNGVTYTVNVEEVNGAAAPAPVATPAPSPTAESSTSPTGRPGSFVREPALCLGVQLPQGSLRAL